MSESNNAEDKKPEVQSKSSMEILSELFSTFHAEPPLIIKKEKSNECVKKHKKKKKHKHKERKHKKKDKKKKRCVSASSNDDSEVDLAKILVRQAKAEQIIKIEGTDVELDLKTIKKEGIKIKKEKSPLTKNDSESDSKQKDSDAASKEDHKSSINRKNKIIIKDLKSSSIVDVLKEKEDSVEVIIDSDDEKKHKRKCRHKYKPSKELKKRSRSKSRDKTNKKQKVEDLSYTPKRHSSRDRSKDRAKHYSHGKGKEYYKGHKTKEEGWDKEKDRYRDRSRDRYRDEYSRELEEYKRIRNKEKDDGFYKSRDRSERDGKWSPRNRYIEHDRDHKWKSTSRDRDNCSKFDKKKLLEIARKNAITMMKSGSLPAALTLGPQAQEKVIAAIKSGGKTIEELTEFCKTLSKKEELGELSSLSEKEDSDSETDKPFHHPFLIKDRPTSITMNIKNSVPLPVKSLVERTSELRMQFPVSSGQQHRKGEEWMPVSPPPAKKEEKSSRVTAPLVPAIASAPVPIAIETPPLPPIAAPPMPVPIMTPSSITPLPIVLPQVQNLALQALPSNTDEQSVDISSIVSQRLTAMRRLQENPHDVQALSQMYKSNKEMQSWASSKQQFGQFTGSTGANILTQAELSSGFQAWAKKDQLTNAAPVTGGMGMHLLQKMGWRPGEGLGKEKSGTLEPLLLDVKLDKRGLVATDEQPHKKKMKMKGQVTQATLQGKHPVSLLGEYASKKKLGAPQYILDFECGPDHKKNFLVKVVLNGVEYKPNVASNNKKEAKAAAATICLQQIGLLPPPESKM